MRATLKPQIREILWAYEKDKDLAKYIERMLELFEESERIIWNEAIEAAALVSEQDHGSYCEEVGNEIRKLKK